jgi:hypothetical protein
VGLRDRQISAQATRRMKEPFHPVGYLAAPQIAWGACDQPP